MTTDAVSEMNLFSFPTKMPMCNITGSDPGYDEACGPGDPDSPLHRKSCWVPVDELFALDPDEPPDYDETEDDLGAKLEACQICITVDPDYVPTPEPAKVACRRFSAQEVLPTAPGVAIVPIKKFDRDSRKWVRILTHVTVSVHKTRMRH